MTTQFDALSQLFGDLTERLIRIETKLDNKADLTVVASIEGRLRDLEMTRAAKVPQIEDTAAKVAALQLDVTHLEDDLKQRKTVEGFRLDTRTKRLAAVVLGIGWAFSLVQAVVMLLRLRG